jgi:hypothetical protein
MNPASPPSAVLTAIEHLLRPLVLLCMRYGIDYRKLSEMLKGVFVSVCEADLAIPGRRQTDSRISLVTGVHRKDVRVLRGRVERKVQLRDDQSVIAHLISRWIGSEELLTSQGDPIPLPRTDMPGYKHSFDSIVNSLTNDIRPRAVYDECLRQGIISVGIDGLIYLKTAALIPDSNLDEKAFFFSQGLHAHLSAAGHNLTGGKPAFLDRYVWQTNLSPEAVGKIAYEAEKVGMKALRTINQIATTEAAEEKGKRADAQRRIHFGVYFFSEHQSDDAEDATDTTR